MPQPQPIHPFDAAFLPQPSLAALPEPAVQPLQSDHHVEDTAEQQSTTPQPEIPINPIQQQPSPNANAHILRHLQIPRVFYINTNGLNFPNVPLKNNSIKIVTNVPRGSMYPTVQLMNNGKSTIPILLYEGNEIYEKPMFIEDVNRTRLPATAQFVIPPTVTKTPVPIAFIFSNYYIASMKVYLN